MSASDHLGRQFHPFVQHYRDGGLGGVGDDHSVVGFVPTETVSRYREHDAGDSDYDRGVVEGIRADIRSGKGITNPLMLDYNHKQGRAVLGEGNHRLAAARAENVPVVPVRVSRAGYDMSEEGAPASHTEIPGSPKDRDYIPTDIHPSYMRLGGE